MEVGQLQHPAEKGARGTCVCLDVEKVSHGLGEWQVGRYCTFKEVRGCTEHRDLLVFSCELTQKGPYANEQPCITCQQQRWLL